MVASKKVSDFVHLLLTLEPRMMFDAAATTTGAETLSQQSVQQSSPSVAVESSSSMEKGEAHLAPASGQSVPLDERTGRQSQTSSEATRYTQVGFPSRKEILFIDSSVKDAETLLSGLDPSIEIYRLDQTIDGISQIADILQHRTGLDAIHLIAHGAEAEIQFGTTKLTSESIMGEFRQQLATIGQSMNSEGDLLIYGCDFGRGDAGQAAMGLLADITGADVQASNNATGATQLGGDWILELSSGPIETLSVVRSASSTQWDGLLAPPQIDLDGNDSSGMTGGNYTTEYPVAGGSLKVTGIDAKLTDPTSATLSSLTVTISNQLNGNSETLSANTTGTSIASLEWIRLKTIRAC
jgi:hypothetical protein